MTATDTESLAAQAAEWIVLLSSDDESQRRRARANLEAWKRADPRHAAAAARMERLIGHADAVRGTGTSAQGAAALGTVLARPGRLRRARAHAVALLLALALAVPAWLALQAYPPAYLMADLRAGTGQWQTQTLPDGTRIMLNSASAVNLRYDAARRAIELIQGEILVEVAKDASRPFLVETRDGSMRVLGTRFIVSRGESSTLLKVLESSVRVQTAAQQRAAGADGITVAAGQQLRFTAAGAGALEAIDARAVEDAWNHHRLFVEDQPLSDVLRTLERYRSGYIGYDAAALSRVRISAVLPLDDTDRALRLLAASLPGLRVRSYTPYLLQVDMAPSP